MMQDASRKTRPARRPFHLMAKPTGFRCNIACDYCFYLEKDSGTLKPDSERRVMSERTLENYVRGYIEASPADAIEFAWQGGEPTLAGIGFFEKALAFQKKYGRGKTITNVIQTNGLLIDARWAQFLGENGFLVGLSIDGPADLHDAHRVSRNGKGVHDRVLGALEQLRAHNVQINILCVVNATTAVHPVVIYRYLTRELGATFIQFIPAVERRAPGRQTGEVLHPQNAGEDAVLTSWSVSGRDYGQFMAAVFDEWVRRDVGSVFVQLFDNSLLAWTGQSAALCVMQPSCGQSLVVEMNGDVYSCDHYVYPQNKLGNINSDALARLVDSKAQRSFAAAKASLPHGCNRCEWRFVCQGGCPKHRIHQAGRQWSNHLCEGYQIMFSHMAPYMDFMADCLRKRQAPAHVMAQVPRILAQAGSGTAAVLAGDT
ncbi:anaerobic sulfatase maturase [Martelella sp. HB161492]|uniref:anaerobic sulfatase maturase n=1 Tax=Martelella sp. HB161492 TaxID=2720726 RepID=UPI001AEE90BA|nr:anaerobic sulfatase maturase [Martelella sp. HB161492]